MLIRKEYNFIAKQYATQSESSTKNKQDKKITKINGLTWRCYDIWRNEYYDVYILVWATGVW